MSTEGPGELRRSRRSGDFGTVVGARGSARTTSVGSKVDMRPVGLDEKLVATGVVGVLAAAAFWPRGKGKR